MYQSRHYLTGQPPSQGGSVDGSTHSRHKRKHHRHESHKSSQHEGNSHKSNKHGGHRREKDRQNARESSRWEGSSCQSSEAGAWSEQETLVPSSRASVCSSTSTVLKFLDAMRNQHGDIYYPAPPSTIADDAVYIEDDVGDIADDVVSDAGQSESSTGTARPRTPHNYVHPNGDMTYSQAPISGAGDGRSESGRSRMSAATVLRPGTQPPGGTHHGRPAHPPGASGHPRNVAGQRSTGPPSVASSSTASSSEDSDDDESSESDLTEFEDDLAGIDSKYATMLQTVIMLKSRLTGIRDYFVRKGHIPYEIKCHYAHIDSYTTKLEYYFNELEPNLMECKAWGSQRAPGFTYTPAGVELAIGEPYKVLKSY